MSITSLSCANRPWIKYRQFLFFALLHRPVFDRLVDWLGFVVADRTRWRPD